MNSVFSQSTRSLSAEFANKFDADSSKNLVYALFDQISQVDLPNIITILPYLYISFQWIDISIVDSNPWDLPALLQDGNVSHTTLTVIYSLAFVLTMFSFIFPILFHKISNRFVTWSLYFTRFCFEVVTPVFLAPIAWEFGYLFIVYSGENGGDIATMMFLIVNIIYYILFMVLYCIYQMLISKTIFMSRNVLYTWSPLQMILFHTVETLQIFFICILSLLPYWTVFILVIFHFLLAAYLIYSMFSLPFFQYYINAYFCGLLTTTMVNDITYIASLDSKYRKIMTFPLLFVFIITYCVIFYFMVKKVAKLLNDDNVVENHEDYLREIRAENHLSYYLHVGLKERTRYFINFSLIKYGVKLHNIDCLRTVVVFPSQTSLLNVIYKQTVTKVDISFGDKFMLYQVNRVKFLRQSSSSLAATEQLDVLKNRARELKSQIKSIWIEGSSAYSEIAKLGSEISLCTTNWKEIVKNIPNSQLIRDEYVKYLIDVETDFNEACRQHYFSQLIGSGRSFANDLCFRSLIYNCPEYLKKGIVDVKGNMKTKGDKKGGSSTNSTKNMSESISSSLDAKMEESIGKIILKNSRLRLALQSSLENKRSANLKHLQFCIAVNFLIGLVLLFFIYLQFKDFLDDKFTMNQRNMYVNDMQIGVFLTSFYAFLAWANETTPPKFIAANASDLNEVFLEGMVPLWNGEYLMTGMGVQSSVGRNNYRRFVNSIADLSSDGTRDVYEITGPFLADTIDMPVCTKNHINGTKKINLKTLYMGTMADYSLVDSLGLPLDGWWTNNKYMCMGYAATDVLEDTIESMREMLLAGSYEECQKSHDLFKILEIAIPICLVVVQVIPFTVFLILTIKETNDLIKMMMTINEELRIEASKSIVKTENPLADQQENVSRAGSNNILIVLIGFINYVLFIISAIILYFSLQEVTNLNDKFMYMDYWCLKNSMRESVTLDSTLCALEAVLASGPNKLEQFVYNVSDKINRSMDKIYLLSELRNDLDVGTENVRPILGYDDRIDFYLYKPNCETSANNTSFHDSYKCGSINHQVSLFETTIVEMSTKLEEYNSTLDNNMCNNLIHLVMAHLIPQLKLLDSLLNDLMETFVSDFDSLFLILFIIGLIITVLMTLMSILFSKILQVPYDAALKVLRKVHPLGIVNSTCLMDYLLDRNSSKQSSEMNTTKAVLHNWTDAVLICSSGGSIDRVNSTITKVIGYTPEQLLGQHISILFNDDDKSKIIQQIQLMQSKQSAPYFEDHMSTISDTEQIVPCLTMLFGVSTNGDQNGDISSFVVILHDETELVNYQDQAEKAKKQSEELLYQILPRDIVIRLNQGEKDISFEVPSASVMFLDIVKFSDFSASLTPSEIMGTLSSLFGAFDELLSKYNLITKIKLIGDVYMAASGLFTPDEPPQHHAEQLLRFGLEALQIVDELNLKNATNLNIRIGMNSGGPLIAGVLGTDKPVFDIIGDTINVASRLQSTDIPSRIQISQGSYDLVNNMDFNIEPRGEIFLKGKGKSNAFLVRPIDAIGSCISSNFQ